jgi:hypothetical protein
VSRRPRPLLPQLQSRDPTPAWAATPTALAPSSLPLPRALAEGLLPGGAPQDVQPGDHQDASGTAGHKRGAGLPGGQIGFLQNLRCWVAALPKGSEANAIF